MEKDVTLTTKDGHVEKAPSAKIDLKTNNLSRAQGVEGNGSFFFLLGVLCLKLRLQYALGADAVHIEIQAQN